MTATDEPLSLFCCGAVFVRVCMCVGGGGGVG